jgi:hypothetical protein
VIASTPEIERGALAAEFAVEDPESCLHVPTMPLEGYRIVEVTIGPDSPASGRRAPELELPAGSLLVAVSEEGKLVAPQDDVQLDPGDRLVLLAPVPSGARNDVSETDVREDRRTAGRVLKRPPENGSSQGRCRRE